MNVRATPERQKLWFSSNEETDRYITENFKEDLLKLANGEYEAWKSERDGAIAAILLCDQFSRNMFRKQKQAFDYDHISRAIVKSFNDEQLKELQYQHIMFVILPLMHSEDI